MAAYSEKKEPDIVKTSSSPPETGHTKTISEKYADETLHFLTKHGDEVEDFTPVEERRLVYKLYFWIMGLILITNLMLFVDKATLAYASILGLFDDTHIGKTDYNNLNTIFYVGYIVAQAPGHLLMQRLPLGRYVGGSVFLWSIIIFFHCLARNYGGLIVLRFLLGLVEACLVPAMEITMGMFFIPYEQALMQPIFWTTCMGAPIPAGFIAYGLLFSTSHVPPWKLFMIVTGGITFFLGIYSFFYYPSNPADAKFLSTREKIIAIRRVHDATKSSIEQKVFKRSQLIETLRDPVSWLFCLAAFALMLSNNLAYQQNLLFVGLGVSDLGSTLVSAASGGYAVLACLVASLLLRWFPNHNAYWAAVWCIPSVAGGIGMVAIAWGKEIALLACLILAGGTFGITYIIALGWTTSSAAGYTKKLTRNVLFMGGYGIANIISPQIWVAKEGPRYYAAWIVQIVISWVGTPVVLLIVRFILSRRNAERRVWIAEQETLGHDGQGFIEELDEEGNAVKVRADVSLLDLTDLENKYFIYPL